MATDKPLEDRIALVTGASRGIGRAAALALARAGGHVILCGRVKGALEDVDDEIQDLGGSATILQLDLRKNDMIDNVGPTLFQRWGKLDILVGNAGILGPLSPLGHVTADAWKLVMDINLNANWRLIRTLDPLLQRSAAGRAVFVSSGAASGKYPYWGPYAVSKAGLEALAKTYAHENENTNVAVNVIDPGPIRTQMREKAFPGEDAEALASPEEIAPLFVELAAASCDQNGDVVRAAEWLYSRALAGSDG